MARVAQSPQEETRVGHTPGPWCFVEDNGGLYRVETTTGAHVTDYVIGEANARLIAAAPDLLEALRNVIRDIATNPNGKPGVFAITEITAREVRAAIARAECRSDA